MNSPNAFGYGEGGAGGGDGGGARPGAEAMAQYKFSPEELRVLGECNRESFWQRSLPLASALGFGTFAGVQAGRLRPNPRFGAFPKVTVAVAVGYFIGKLSYQRACAEKLMALPNSYIGQLLRDRRDGKIEGRSGLSGSGVAGVAPGDVYSDAGPGSALDLDTERPSFSDDSFRPDNYKPSTPEAAPAPALSYDELRRQNRGNFQSSKQDPYRVEGGLGPAPPPPRRARPPPPPTNQYGDALD